MKNQPPERTVASVVICLALLIAAGLVLERPVRLLAQFSSVDAARLCAADGQCHTNPAVTSDTIALLAASQTFTNKTLTNPSIAFIGINCSAAADAVLKACGQYYSPLVADGNSGTTKTLDWNAGNEHLLTLTGNVTLTLSNPVDGGRYVVALATGAGSFTVTWPAAVLWSGGTAPVITTAASKVDLCTLMYFTVTTKYYAACSQNY